MQRFTYRALLVMFGLRVGRPLLRAVVVVETSDINRVGPRHRSDLGLQAQGAHCHCTCTQTRGDTDEPEVKDSQ